jgi:hypothetical protein
MAKKKSSGYNPLPSFFGGGGKAKKTSSSPFNFWGSTGIAQPSAPKANKSPALSFGVQPGWGAKSADPYVQSSGPISYDAQRSAQPAAPHAKTFADYLSAAQQYVPGGTDYNALMATERGNAGESTARIAAMYKQLQGSYAADAGTIKNDFTAAGSDTKQNGTEATNSINQAYNGTRDAVSKQLAALGIQDAAAVLASQGSNAANDQARTLSAVAENSQGNQNNLVQHRSNALTYNTGIKGAAGLEGTLQQAVIQKQLNDALANLQQQQSQQDASRQQSAFSIAQQLQQSDALAANGGLTAAQKAAQDEAFAKIAASSASSKASQSASSQQKQTQTYLALLKQYNGDEDHALRQFKAMKAAGLI